MDRWMDGWMDGDVRRKKSRPDKHFFFFFFYPIAGLGFLLLACLLAAVK